jgi:hypothetical protein
MMGLAAFVMALKDEIADSLRLTIGEGAQRSLINGSIRN